MKVLGHLQKKKKQKQCLSCTIFYFAPFVPKDVRNDGFEKLKFYCTVCHTVYVWFQQAA